MRISHLSGRCLGSLGIQHPLVDAPGDSLALSVAEHGRLRPGLGRKASAFLLWEILQKQLLASPILYLIHYQLSDGGGTNEVQMVCSRRSRLARTGAQCLRHGMLAAACPP